MLRTHPSRMLSGGLRMLADHLKSQEASALRHRDFALLWSGQTISLAGNGMYTVALPLEVLRLTGSPLDLALVASARTVSSVLVLLVGGALVDRLPRRSVMLVSDAVCAIAVAVTGLLIAVGVARLWELAALSVIFGLASAFFMPASSAIAADILPPQALVSASSLTSMSQTLFVSVLGPMAGGLVVAFTGNAWAFGLDGLSFAISAGFLAAMQRTRRPQAESTFLLEQIREGIRYCRSQPWLWWSTLAVGLANFACYVPIAIIEPVMARDVFQAGPAGLGVLLAAGGAGGTLASIIAGRQPRLRRRVTCIWLAWAGAGFAAAAMGIAPWLWLAAVFAGLTMAGITYGNVVWLPLLQQEVPPGLLSRVSSVDWLLSLGLAPLGTLAAGAAAGALGARVTLIAGGLAAAATGSVLLLPGVTEPDRREAEQLRPS
jgi:predicted MFS family arabinose efflux permease